MIDQDHAPGACGVTGKLSFFSRTLARKAGKRKNSKYHTHQFDAYQCQHCTLWHLTKKRRVT